MKFLKKILFPHLFTILVTLLMLDAVSAKAQRGNDVYAVPRQVVLYPPYNTLSTTTKSNMIDCLLFTGIGKVTIMCTTNTGASGGTMAFQLCGSNDNTNWTALSGLAYITNTTSVSYTNTTWGTGGTITTADSILLPGTITTPTPATAGFATTYLSPLPFTSTGAITVANVASELEIGINWDACPRYVSLQATCAGTANFTYSATADGYVHSY